MYQSHEDDTPRIGHLVSFTIAATLFLSLLLAAMLASGADAAEPSGLTPDDSRQPNAVMIDPTDTSKKILVRDVQPVTTVLADCSGEGFMMGPDFGTDLSLPELIATYCYHREVGPPAQLAGEPDDEVRFDFCAGEGLAGGKNQPVLTAQSTTTCYPTARFAGPADEFEPLGRIAGRVDE